MVALDTSVVNISKYKQFVLTSDRKQICPAKLKHWTTFCIGRAGTFSPLSSPLFPKSYLFKFNLVISYSKHLYNQRQHASWRDISDISDTSPPNFLGKLIFIIDDGGPQFPLESLPKNLKPNTLYGIDILIKAKQINYYFLKLWLVTTCQNQTPQQEQTLQFILQDKELKCQPASYY